MALYNFSDVYQGSTFSTRLCLRDSAGSSYNLSGWSVRGHIRTAYGETGVLVYLNPTVFSAVSGLIDIVIEATGTATIPAGRFLYDIEMYTSGSNPSVIKPLHGAFFINPEATY